MSDAVLSLPHHAAEAERMPILAVLLRTLRNGPVTPA